MTSEALLLLIEDFYVQSISHFLRLRRGGSSRYPHLLSQHVCIASGAWQGREQCPGQHQCWSSSLQPVTIALHSFLAHLSQCLFSLPRSMTKLVLM